MSHICQNLDEVRLNIDRIDRSLLELLAERGTYVRQAAAFKKTAAEVPAPQRVEQVIRRITALAPEFGADPRVAEATWRAMIAAFIEAEMATHAALHTPPPTH
jgi:isochorismate pyruvate lyase